ITSNFASLWQEFYSTINTSFTNGHVDNDLGIRCYINDLTALVWFLYFFKRGRNFCLAASRYRVSSLSNPKYNFITICD
ncbi:hypothetical protein P3539_23415, partial [Vibrio parahaemolyticus]|nr:hypothetical protein [Vibrio parahaemolyticus]